MKKILHFSFKPQRNLLFLFFLFVSNAVLAQTATITTDYFDYPPGSTVIISGEGWLPGETVTLQVIHYLVNGDNNTSPAHQPFTAIADANGYVNSTWYVGQDKLGATMLLTARGQTSGLYAEVTFTDANLNSVTVGPASPLSVNYGTGGVVNYTVAVRATGSGSGPTNVNLSISTLPTGVTAFWSTNPISFSGASTINVTLTLLVQNNAKVLAVPTFTVTATADGTTRTGDGILTINRLAINGSITVDSKVYNATTAATIASRTPNGVINGDNVTYSGGTAIFSNKNVGIGKTVSASGLSLTGPDAGNYTINSTANTTADITAKAITGSITATSKQYDGTTTATIATRTLSGAIGADVVTYTGGTATFDTKDVGNGKTITATGLSLTGADAVNYVVNTGATTTANVTPKAITGSITAENKVYNGATTATILTRTLIGVIAPDDVTYSGGIANFSDADVATGKTVTGINLVLGGTNAGNYTVNATATTTANITPKTITASITASNKVYDGNTSATLLTQTLNGAEAVDLQKSNQLDLNIGPLTFDNKNAGTGKTVSASGLSLSGTSAGNYNLNPTTATTTANITPRSLTVTLTGGNKVYDGTTTASPTLADNRVSGDILTVSYNTPATFASKNVGSGITITATGIVISGTDKDNYSLQTTSATTLANISKKALVITVTGINKVYDGNVTATVTLNDNRILGDVFTDSYTTASFANKNAAIGKTVSVSGISISGTDAANYNFNTSASTTANITARALIISATGVNKVYDGNATATVTLSDDKIAGDVITDTYTSASFNNKNAGTSKPVSVSGISISGTDAGNYSFNITTATTADITTKVLTISATASSKVYDGNANASATLTDNRVAGDVFTDSYSSASFNDKNVGSGKAVSVIGISISGTDAANYTFNTIGSATADISARTLTISAAGINKIYDGNAAATVTLSDDRLAGDVFTVSYSSALFNDKNAGTGKPVSVIGISIGGTSAANYTFNTTASTTAAITAKILTVSATGINKVYNGNAAATVTLSDDRLGGDIFTDSYITAMFVDKNVGTAKTISITGISISGSDAANYTFNTAASASANITARVLIISATGINKVYDGNVVATVTLADDRIAGDLFTDSYGSASFSDKNIGTGKTVSASGISISGTDATNYTSNTSASTTADITAKTLIVTATGINKVYDGNAIATVTLNDNRVAGDVFTGSYLSASFNDKNAGVGKAVSVTGISTSGSDAGNYTFNTTASTTAAITAKALIVSATGINKVYNGNATATVTLSDDRLAGDVFTGSYTTAMFVNKNVGTGKAVNITGISISGSDAANYTFNTAASATANITARVLIVSATGINKVYDGNTVATVTLTDDRIAGDLFTDSYGSASFGDKNIGTGKTVSASGISISGTDATNYTSNTSASTTADITAKTLIVTATGINKVYDGNAIATVTLSDNRVAGDVFTGSYLSASFNDKNTGIGKPVSVIGISNSGSDAGNYTFNTTASTTAAITAKALTVSATGIDKVYNGNAAATVTLSDDRLAGDVFTDSYTTAMFVNKNVGTGKAVSITGISISGGDAANYTFNTAASATANITARVLIVSATGINKVYDGNTVATVTLADDRIAGDLFTESYASASFSDKNIGTGKTVSASGINISGTDATNYTSNTNASTTADITAKTLIVTVTGVNKVYDGSAAATVTLTDNRIAGDVFTDSYTTAMFVNKNVGTGKAVSVTGISISGSDAANYSFNTIGSSTANITARVLVISATGINKVYDGNTVATVTLADDRIAGDLFTDSYGSAAFSDKNIGTGKTVSAIGISISGTDATNYTSNTSASATADITAKTLIVTATGINKIYDGNATATVTLSDNRVAGDVFTGSYLSASFNNKNAGIGKPVSVIGISTSGSDAGNYTFNTTASTTAAITTKVLTVSATGINKVYNGNAAATVTLSDDRLAGDVFTGSYTTAMFVNKNVGTGKAVSVTGISISGSDAGNYTFNAAASATANITARVLIISATGINKVYDGNTVATVTLADDRIAGDLFTDSYGSASFSDKNIGIGKTVSASSISISGTDATNYTSNNSASTTADITAKTLIVTATGINKVYDGNAIATVTLSDNRVAGDVFTGSYLSASFNDKNAGVGKPVSVTGISTSGSDAGNYTFNTTASTTAAITAKALTVSATGINKVYNGNAAATVTLSDDRLAGDVFTDSYTTAMFINKNVGTGKAVSVTGISISGSGAANYTFNTTASATANITARVLIVSATGINKVYDGNAAATVTLSDDRVAGDVFTDSYSSASFSDKNIGTGKTVSASGISISGTDAANYTFNITASATANITARVLIISSTGINKVYDGNAVATVTLSDNRVTGDVFTNSYSTAMFLNKNVGTAKTVSVSGIGISGTDAGNYTFNTTASTTANITARVLIISATGINKVYDGNSVATATLGDNRLAGDVFTDSYTSASFNDKNAGVGKPVSVIGISISGTDAANYTSNATASTTADITARALIVTATGINKVYDGNSVATVTLGDNRVAGNVFTATYSSASFSDKNAGVGKSVSVIGINISGTDAGNYTFNTTTGTTANITPKALLITANAATRQYSDPNPAFSVIYATFAAGDGSTNLGGTLIFTTSAAATSGPGSYIITPGGVTSSNYTITFQTGALTITKEDARITYTGSSLAATSSPTATTATVTLSATIQDITAALGDPAYDSYPGDIRNATVTFNVDGIDKATVPIGLVNSGDTQTGTALYVWTGATLGEHTIIIKLNGYYQSTSFGDNLVVVEVYQPNGDFITGGGYLKITNSSGLKAGDAGTKNNFGFNVKYNKGGTNLQGTINTIIRRMESGVLHVYQVKGNAMTSLSVDASITTSHPYPTAVFNGKANITDITNPLSPISLGGNSTLQVSMTDAGEPGSADKIGIIVYNNTGGVWFSSNWDGTKTVQQTLAGGNMVVHGSNTAAVNTVASTFMETASAQVIPVGNKFDVKVLGNPTETYFTVQVKSNTNPAVEIKVFDLTGRQVQQARGGVGESFRLGSMLTQGVYVVEVRQGLNHSIIKVVKN